MGKGEVGIPRPPFGRWLKRNLETIELLQERPSYTLKIKSPPPSLDIPL
jgi:hypothetical protein